MVSGASAEDIKALEKVHCLGEKVSTIEFVPHKYSYCITTVLTLIFYSILHAVVAIPAADPQN